MDTKQSANISCDVTLFIRLMEVAREELKSDAELHYLVERCSEQQALKSSPLTMDDYDKIMPSSINAAVRLRASTPNLTAFKQDLVRIGKEYHPSIPMREIMSAAVQNGLVLLQEDGTEWEGMLTGREGRCTIDLGDAELKPINKYLHMQWFKMGSGKYEVNCYIS